MLNVAIVAGGGSGEHGISVKSSRQVELHMDRERFNPYVIDIRGTAWNYRIGYKRFPIDKNDFSLAIGRRKIRFDLVFNAIHGTPGENGKLQGYFDLLGIPYTSSGVTTSALTFNKSFCKDVVSACGIRTAKSLHLFKGRSLKAADILKEIPPPLFVKPNNGGSSVGMSKVNAGKDLRSALDTAFREDDEILVEEFIPGRELTCGVIRTRGQVLAFPVTEIIPVNEYFDYEAKYTRGKAKEVVPAQVEVEISQKLQNISALLYEKLDCRGVVRFDYIFTGREFYFLEVNTVPGMSEASIVPKMARAHGWTFRELITRMIEESL